MGRKSFASTDPQNHQGDNTWFTPRHIVEALGPFDLDPCTMSFRPFPTAAKHIEHDKGQCGLLTQWKGEVWLNPPYGKEMSPFIDRFILHGKGVALIFARMGNKDVQKLITAGAHFYFLRERIRFINRRGETDSNAGTDSCLVFFDFKYASRCAKLNGVIMPGQGALI